MNNDIALCMGANPNRQDSEQPILCRLCTRYLSGKIPIADKHWYIEAMYDNDKVYCPNYRP